MLFSKDHFSLLDAITYGGLIAFLVFTFKVHFGAGLLLGNLLGLSFLMGHKTAHILARRAVERRDQDKR